MNAICISEYAEYEGQYVPKLNGAYKDCNCVDCYYKNNIGSWLSGTTNWIEYKPKEFLMKGRWIDNWFSNMTTGFPITIDGIKYNTVENYYVAMKVHPDTILLDRVREAVGRMSPQEAKHYGRTVRLRPDWEKVKEEVMYKALVSKFTTYDKARKELLGTGYIPIIEWNNWNDKYWGVDSATGEGKNRLGVLLMSLRHSFIHNK